MRTALAAVAGLALSIALGATALAASPVPGTLGLQLTPAPIHVDDGVREFTATNRSGGLALAVTLTPSAGYAVEPSTFTLAPDAEQAVTVTAVNPSADGTLEALAVTTSADTTATVRSAIALSTRFVHRTFLDDVLGVLGGHGAEYALLLIAAVTVGFVALVGAARRRRRA